MFMHRKRERCNVLTAILRFCWKWLPSPSSSTVLVLQHHYYLSTNVHFQVCKLFSIVPAQPRQLMQSRPGQENPSFSSFLIIDNDIIY